MFQAVIVFGAAMVVFAFSHWMLPSVLALALLGAADTVSVVICFALVQLSTNFLFINASNQLSQSGVTAALFGTIRSRIRRRCRDRRRALWMKLIATLREGRPARIVALESV